jgi:site-specific DNA-methyltransferase (adenine-specific)
MINQILHGDCRFILQDIPNDSVDMVYLDPPFFTQSTHALKSNTFVEYQFQDKWDSLSEYLQFLKVSLLEVKRVMKNHATLYVHCDRNASHYIRVLLDEVFGYERFLSEIIWTYKRWSNASRNLLPAHQTIFAYTKSETYIFNTLYQDYSDTTNLDQILQRRERNSQGKTVYAVDEHGEVILNGPKKGVPLSDTWEIPFLNPKAKERTGYPTQKPLLLLERIIMLSSNENDLILDPFCGSGTTCVAAALLQRQFIGIDISQEAVQLSQERLKNPIRSDSDVLNKGREAYKNLPDYVEQILKQLPVKLVQRNSGIDAIHNEFINGQPIVIKVQRTEETLSEAALKLQQASAKKKACLMILIRTQAHDQQTALFDVVPHTVIVVDSVILSLQKTLHEFIETHKQTML